MLLLATNPIIIIIATILINIHDLHNVITKNCSRVGLITMTLNFVKAEMQSISPLLLLLFVFFFFFFDAIVLFLFYRYIIINAAPTIPLVVKSKPNIVVEPLYCVEVIIRHHLRWLGLGVGGGL